MSPSRIRQIAPRASAAEAVRRQLLALIEAGEYRVGERIPSENALAKSFGVSRPIAATAVPAFAWEVSLAAYLIIRGIRQPSDTSPSSQLPSETATSVTVEVESATASQRG